jgi:hypothetical protein
LSDISSAIEAELHAWSNRRPLFLEDEFMRRMNSDVPHRPGGQLAVLLRRHIAGS